MDEIRTLKVKLARAQQINAQTPAMVPPQAVQPAFIAQGTPVALAKTNLALPNLDLGQALQALIIRGLAASDLPSTQDQFVNTRTGAGQKNGAGSQSNL